MYGLIASAVIALMFQTAIFCAADNSTATYTIRETGKSINTRCPVCGMSVDASAPMTVFVTGNDRIAIGNCGSLECREKIIAQPAKYAQAARHNLTVDQLAGRRPSQFVSATTPVMVAPSPSKDAEHIQQDPAKRYGYPQETARNQATDRQIRADQRTAPVIFIE